MDGAEHGKERMRKREAKAEDQDKLMTSFEIALFLHLVSNCFDLFRPVSTASFLSLPFLPAAF
jgi:hypothetical protein